MANGVEEAHMQIPQHEPIIAFTLARYPRSQSMIGLAHLGLDRWSLARTPGLSFWRLLGVGRGRVFDPHADLQRYALFTVWSSYADLKQFETSGSVMRSIQRRAEEVWTVHMQPVRWHGKWGGRDPFAGITPVAAPEPGPWIILTRATIRPTKLAAFLGAVPSIAEDLLQQPELLNSVGVGEAPLLYQATVSLWRTLPSLQRFAYSHRVHKNIVQRTRQERWYREELFARLRPIASFGTWDGIDPLKS